jgi:hypothetical protein
VHVPIFKSLKRVDAAASDYWAIWVLLIALLKKFEMKEAIKALPMLFRLLDVSTEIATVERRACIEGVFVAFVFVIAEKFGVDSLRSAASKAHPLRYSLISRKSSADVVWMNGQCSSTRP